MKLALCASILKKAEDEINEIMKEFIDKPENNGHIGMRFHNMATEHVKGDKAAYNIVDKYFEYYSNTYTDEHKCPISLFSKHVPILDLSIQLDCNEMVKEPSDSCNGIYYSHPKYIVPLHTKFLLIREEKIYTDKILLNMKWVSLDELFDGDILKPHFISEYEPLELYKVKPFEVDGQWFAKVIFKSSLPF